MSNKPLVIVDPHFRRMNEIFSPDGYLGTYITVVEPGGLWTNLRKMHELYSAVHFIEAAVVYHQVTGKGKLLDSMEGFHTSRSFGENR